MKLAERFETLGRTRTPDLWPEVVRREPRPLSLEVQQRHRALTAALALAVAMAAIGLTFRAFVGTVERSPVSTQEPDISIPQLYPHVTSTVRVGSEGGAVLFAFDSVWVTTRDDVGAGYVVRVDPATNGVVARVPVDAVPGWEGGGGGLAAGAGSIWVTGGGRFPGGASGALLHRIDARSNDVQATIVLDQGRYSHGQDVTVSDDAVWVVLSADDGEGARDFVAKVAPATNEVVAKIPLEHQWAHWIATTGDRVVVLEHRTFGEGNRAGVFTTIDARTNEVVASVEPDLHGPAWGLALWGDQVWTDAGGWELAGVDPLTGDAVPFDTVLAVSFEGLAVGEGGIWFVGYNSNAKNERPVTINRLNPNTRMIDVSVETPLTRGGSIAVGGGAVWHLGLYPGDLTRIDLAPPARENVDGHEAGFVAPLVARFMQARIEGFGAGQYVTGGGLDAWTSGLEPLYSPEGVRYESFAIVFVDDLGNGSYEVGIRMFGALLDGEDEWFTEPLFEETLFVGPGEGLDGEQHALLVTGGRSGLEGP